MTEFNYPLWLNQAFLEVLKKSLKVASEYESLEDNSLYISFKVNYDGVQLSRSMRERFPEEIMIVIQNEYWNLQVNEENFSIDLSFNGVLETVIVPYKAIISFSDPEYKVGYEFIGEEFLTSSADDQSHKDKLADQQKQNENENDNTPNMYDEDEISKTLTDILAKKSPFEKDPAKPKKKAKIVTLNKK